MKFGKVPYLFLISTSLITTTAFAKNTVVVDAGSSGSRLYDYHYHYHNSTASGKGLPVIDSNASTKVSGGIQDIDYSDLDMYLKTLFANVKMKPEKIDFYSTAGMRLISAQKREEINEKVKDWIKSNYPSAIVDVKTIRGQVEGAYAWLASNYLNGSLEKRSETTGIMDLGGASTQITFESKGTNSLAVPISNHTYHLSSNSFLGLGQDQAISQYFNEPSCFPVGYSLPNHKLGTGKFQECAKKVTSLINKVHHVDSSIDTVPDKHHIYAISGFYYTAKELNLPDDFTLAKLAKKGDKFCSSNWRDLKSGSAGYDVNDYLYSYCFNSAYQYALMSKGYHFGDHDRNISAINKIDDNSISWTLGPIISPSL